MKRRANNEGSVYQRSDGRWAASVSVPHGGRKSYYGKTRQEVLGKLRRAVAALESGRPLTPERLTLGAFLERWLEEVARPSLRPRTFEGYRMIIHHHLIPALGRMRLSQLTPDALQGYMKAKRESGLSARTVQYHHAVLRRALAIAERWGLVGRNVARLVSPPRVERSEVHPPTLEQARHLLQSLQGDRLRALYMMALGLGLRQGEILGLRWEDLDLEGGSLTVSHTLQRYGGEYHLDPPKTWRSRRTISLPSPLIEALKLHRLRQLQEQNRAEGLWQGPRWGLVFLSEEGGPLLGKTVTVRFQKLLERAELPRWRFHDLRHAAASFMVAQVVSLRTAMEVLGHSTIAVTANTYSHVMPELVKEAGDRVAGVLFD